MVLNVEFGDDRLDTRVEISPGDDGGFARLFDMGIRTLERLGDERILRLGRIVLPSVAEFQSWFSRIEERFPVKVETPFEGSDFIGGGAWLGSEHFGQRPDDALAKLCFAKGAVDLPMHAHEHSDRFIVVLEGEGRYHHASGSVHEFTGEGVQSVPVRAGDLVVFTRGLVHTFSTPDRPMTLLSWHRPYFAFLDPRQYRLPRARVCPDGPHSVWQTFVPAADIPATAIDNNWQTGFNGTQPGQLPERAMARSGSRVGKKPLGTGDVLTIDELAAYLKLAKSTTYKLAQEGKIPGQKVGRHWRFNKAAIDRWLASGSRAK